MTTFWYTDLHRIIVFFLLLKKIKETFAKLKAAPLMSLEYLC